MWGRTKNFQILRNVGSAGSYAEHSVIQDLFLNFGFAQIDSGQPQGISAVKALAIAGSQGQRVCALNSGNS